MNRTTLVCGISLLSLCIIGMVAWRWIDDSGSESERRTDTALPSVDTAMTPAPLKLGDRAPTAISQPRLEDGTNHAQRALIDRRDALHQRATLLPTSESSHVDQINPNPKLTSAERDRIVASRTR